MERYIVVDNVCGWPKLTLLDDGSINLDIHNKPSHGSLDGSAECWKSTDGGRIFEKVGVSGQGSKEKGSYVDKACGVTNNGDYIVITENRRVALETQVFRSSDGGRTFKKTGVIESGRTHQSNHGAMPYPYGTIQRLGNNKLVFHYFMNTKKDWDKGYADAVHEAHICISNDDGLTWTEDYIIDEGINETALLFYDEKNAIAVGRIDSAFMDNSGGQRDAGGGNRIYRTNDGGKTWSCEGQILGQCMIPAHLLRLKDGKTLMTFGYRFANIRGVMVTVSSDDGRTWSDPYTLVQYPRMDSGYPSTIELDDGTLVTAYYCQGNMYHTRYHVGVIRYRLSDLLEGKWVDGRGPVAAYLGTDEEYEVDWRI